MQRVLRYLAADYARSRIDKLTNGLMLAGVPVAVFARWDVACALVGAA